jgi:hypothetical protein
VKQLRTGGKLRITKREFAMMVRAICVALLFAFAFVPEARGFDEPDLLSQPTRPTVIKAETLEGVLATLTSDYGVPIGIELVDEKSTPSRRMDLNLRETTLKDFLDAVVAKDPRYTWKLEGGVIHVRPSKERDALLSALLDTKISHFGFTEGLTRYAIFNDLMKVPEIQTQLIVADVAPLIFINFGLMHRVGKGISFQESNLTLRELLDRMLLKTDIKRWVLLRWGKNSEYITLRS